VKSQASALAGVFTASDNSSSVAGEREPPCSRRWLRKRRENNALLSALFDSQTGYPLIDRRVGVGSPPDFTRLLTGAASSAIRNVTVAHSRNLRNPAVGV
jgi:hypothetical protein